MSESGALVVHVVDALLTAERGATLEALRASTEPADRQPVLAVGSGGGCIPVRDLTAHIRPLAGPAWVGRALGSRRWRALAGGVPARWLVVHAWSKRAAEWVLRCRPTGCAVVIEVEPEDPDSLAAACRRSPGGNERTAFVCRSEAARERLLQSGLRDEQCVLTRPWVDWRPPRDGARQAARTELDLRHEDGVVLAVPPVARSTGTFVAAWAALLAQKAHPRVRFVVPDGGPERERVRRLGESCGHESVMRFAPPGLSFHDVLAAADLAVFLPSGLAETSGLAAAMAAGCPILASEVPAVTELLTGGRNAWLCRPNSPEDAARQMVLALEDPGQSRRQAELARTRASELFSKERTIAAYRGLYERLVADAARTDQGVSMASPNSSSH